MIKPELKIIVFLFLPLMRLKIVLTNSLQHPLLKFILLIFTIMMHSLPSFIVILLIKFDLLIGFIMQSVTLVFIALLNLVHATISQIYYLLTA